MTRSQKGTSVISSILVSEKNPEEMRRSLVISAFCSLFCLVFYLIYNIFSHGVHSPFMTFLFAWPLVLCVLPYALFVLVPGLPGPSLLSSLVWNTGTAAVTISSLLRGVFDIAGNSSFYQVIMMAAGFILLICGLILYIKGIMLLKKS